MLNSLRSRMLMIVIISMTIISMIVTYSVYYIVTDIFFPVFKGLSLEAVFYLTENMIQHELDKELIEKNIPIGSSELPFYSQKKIINKIEDYILKINKKTGGENIFSLFVFDAKKNILLDPYGRYKKIISSCHDSSGNQVNEKCLDIFIASERNRDARKVGYGRAEISVSASSGQLELIEINTSYIEDIDWYVSVIWPEETFRRGILAISFIILSPVILFFICFILSVSCLVFRAFRPLELLSTRIAVLSDYDFTTGDPSELTRDLPLKAKNEIGQLARTFAVMTDQLTNNIRQLVATTALAERMQSELNVAREIQMGTLPTDFTFEPEHKELDIYAYILPAREVGGDLYDFFFVDEEHLCFTLGDVAGKGVPAALFMVITKELISNNVLLGNLSPADVMTWINKMLYRGNPSSMFVTLIIGILNVKTGMVHYANGGHVPPIFVGCEDGPCYKKELSGPVVGALPGVNYRDISVTLQPGEAFFLCSDGVTEAMNEEEELFGDKRLIDDFARMKDSSSKEAIEGVLREVRKHAGNAPQSDDIAMMMIRWNPDRDKAKIPDAEGYRGR